MAVTPIAQTTSSLSATLLRDAAEFDSPGDFGLDGRRCPNATNVQMTTLTPATIRNVDLEIMLCENQVSHNSGVLKQNEQAPVFSFSLLMTYTIPMALVIPAQYPTSVLFPSSGKFISLTF